MPDVLEIPGPTRAVFDAADPAVRARLVALRALIFRTAGAVPAIPALSETLKWGEPSYSPAKKGIGSSVRLAARKDGAIGLMFICHTDLVAQFRELYSGKLRFEGNRAIVVSPDGALPEAELGHCIALALTCKLKKRANPVASSPDTLLLGYDGKADATENEQ